MCTDYYKNYFVLQVAITVVDVITVPEKNKVRDYVHIYMVV